MDTNTGLAILGTAIGSAKLIEKILGPTADYIGCGVKNWTERRVNNVSRIFEHAAKKLGAKLEDKGAVPPRVLKGILDEGSFFNDELAAEYFGGVLASSKSDVSRDDRGIYFIGLINRLTSYQLRTHYIFYQVVKLLFDGEPLLVTTDDRRSLETYIPYESYISAMEFSPNEDFDVIFNHVMFGLSREDLIEKDFKVGPAERIRNIYGEDSEGGIYFLPTALGAELFLWAHGMGNITVYKFLDPEVKLVSETKMNILLGYNKAKKPS